MSQGGFCSFPDPVSGVKIRKRSETFGDHDSQAASPRTPARRYPPSRMLSMLARGTPMSVKGRKIAILAADGVDGAALQSVKSALLSAGAKPRVVSLHLGALTGGAGGPVMVDDLDTTMPSIMFDAVVVAPGAASVAALKGSGDMLPFVREAYKHAKPIAAPGDGAELLAAAGLANPASAGSLVGVTVGSDPVVVVKAFLTDVGQYRVWDRDT